VAAKFPPLASGSGERSLGKPFDHCEAQWIPSEVGNQKTSEVEGNPHEIYSFDSSNAQK